MPNKVPVVRRGTTIGFRQQGVMYGNRFGAASETWWNDAPLRLAGLKSFRSAAIEAGGVARSKATSRRVARSVSVRLFSGGARTEMNIAGIVRASNPLAHLFEEGVDPHGIAPRNSLQSLIERGRASSSTRQGRSVRRSAKGKIAMKFPDGGFSKGTVQHPGMQARPFLRPAAAIFPVLFNRQMSRNLRNY